MNLRILCFNIHKGCGWAKGQVTFPGIQSKLAEFSWDMVFLQEIRGIQIAKLAEENPLFISYGKNAFYPSGDHGNAILSKYPFTFSNNIDLSMHRFERRGLLHCIVTIPSNKHNIHLLCLHLGLFLKDRRKQIKIVMDYINNEISTHDPIILAGDFNDWIGHITQPIVNSLGFQEVFLSITKRYAKTFPAWAPILKLDRIYFKGFNVNSANRLANKPWKHLSDHIALETSLTIRSEHEKL